MSGRLKVLLAVLAVGAGSVFWYSIQYGTTEPTTNRTATLLDQVSTQESCGDVDSDGLCDYDETYWGSDFKNADSDGDGYSDGEEVLSGHDPMKEGPDDFLNDKRNLTERASDMLLGGLMTGELDPDSPNYRAAIDALVDDIFKQYDANVATELDSIALASGSAEDLISYSFRMSQTMQLMFAEIRANYKSFLGTAKNVPLADLPSLDKKNPEVFKAFTAAADTEATAFSERTRAMKLIKVPPQLAPFHRSLLLYLNGTQQRYLTVKNITHDPLQGMISLQVLSTLTGKTLLELTVSFQNQVADAINSK